MASISNIPNARIMNGIITLTDRHATIENGSITSDNITTYNTTTDDINLNIGDDRSLSVYDDLNDRAKHRVAKIFDQEISSQLGHLSLQSTSIYRHPSWVCPN